MISHRPNQRRGNAVRALLVMLAAIVALPILAIVIWFQQRSQAQLQAQESALRDQAAMVEAIRASEPVAVAPIESGRRDAVEPEAAAPIRASESSAATRASMYQRAPETVYELQTVEVDYPEVDPETGQMIVKRRQEVRRVPKTIDPYFDASTGQVTTNPGVGGRPVPPNFFVADVVNRQSVLDPRVQQLATELRALNEDDENREAKLMELRKRLELEFSQMHDYQASEIKRTEERLESLKKLHQERGQNSDRIVQRRIDELLGRTDALQWNPPPPGPPAQGQTTYVPSAQGQTTYEPTTTAPPSNVIPYPTPPAPSTGRPLGLGTPRPGFRPRPPAIPTKDDSEPLNSAGIASPPRINTIPSGSDSSLQDPVTNGNAPPIVTKPVEENRSEFQPPVVVSRVEDATSLVTRLFTLSRSSANATAELAEAKVELERLQKLRDSPGGPAIVSQRLEKTKIQVARLQRELEFNGVEIQALTETLERNVRAAEASCEHAQRSFEVVKAVSEQGLVSNKELLDAQFEVTKARSALEDAVEISRQAQEARKLIESSTQQPKKKKDAEDGSDDAPTEPIDDPEPLNGTAEIK